jgi:hypothetical protein
MATHGPAVSPSKLCVMNPFSKLHRHRALRGAFVIALALAMAACGPRTESPQPAPASHEWREFEGSWNAAGTRQTISLGAERKGSIVDLRGTMLLAGPGRPGVGFLSEVIALVDIEGTILGGTGRYAGATGSYEFSWQFVIESEEGSIQGRAVGLKGRIRPGQPNAGGSRP